jgi:hypothetical protein
MSLFNTYWGGDEAVHVLCENLPDFDYPSNFIYTKINNGFWPKELWANGLRMYLEALPTPNAVLLLDDYLLTRHVDRNAVQLLSNYIINYDNILRIDLTNDRLCARGDPANVDNEGVCNYIDLISAKGTSYEMSLQCGLFDISLLSKILVDGMNPWEIELQSQSIIDNNKMIVLGTRQCPVKYINALGTGTPEGTMNLTGVNPSMIERAIYNKWIPEYYSIIT